MCTCTYIYTNFAILEKCSLNSNIRSFLLVLYIGIIIKFLSYRNIFPYLLRTVRSKISSTKKIHFLTSKSSVFFLIKYNRTEIHTYTYTRANIEGVRFESSLSTVLHKTIHRN